MRSHWLTAMAAGSDDHEIVVDIDSGTFGHRVSMLDLNPAQLARFRDIGRLVELPDRPGVVETALALSGSAAQSKVQAYPGDADFFERVNILTPTREARVRDPRRAHAGQGADHAGGPDHRFMEMRLGSYPERRRPRRTAPEAGRLGGVDAGRGRGGRRSRSRAPTAPPSR